MEQHPVIERLDQSLAEVGVPVEQQPDSQAPLTRQLSDLGNSERLVDEFGEMIRYCPAGGVWLVWTGKRWEEDRRLRITQMAKDVVRRIYHEASALGDEYMRKKLAKHALRSESSRSLAAMVDLARSAVAVLQEDLDADDWLLNCDNGIVDLRTGELLPHDPERLMTKLVPVRYDPAAEAPLWIQFLERITAGNAELVSFLQRTAGYCLTGDISEQCVFIFYGIGANGKTTFMNLFLALAGDYATQGAPDLLIAPRGGGDRHPTEQADLLKRRLVVCQETDGGRYIAEATLKQLTGGDRIKARFMRKDFFEFQPTHKLFLATNHKPQVRGTDHGFWRRIRLIPFGVTIPESEQDKLLEGKLRRELPGILAWAVEGCLQWQAHGLEPPDDVSRATQTYRGEQDVLGGFLYDCCREAPELLASAADLYHSYTEWCTSSGERAKSQRRFGQALGERGFNRGRNSSGRIEWRGVGLLHVAGDDR